MGLDGRERDAVSHEAGCTVSMSRTLRADEVCGSHTDSPRQRSAPHEVACGGWLNETEMHTWIGGVARLRRACREAHSGGAGPAVT